MAELDKEAFQSIKKGSLSFDLASRFFNKDERISAAQIYSWCRYCDDVVDESKATFESLEQLRKDTVACWDASSEVAGVFRSFREAVIRSTIPSVYAEELLLGMRMDLINKRYNTLPELKLYCYRVASTVGLMMCHVMGVFSQKALGHAVSLGIAMQMTNICRDVKADKEIGRLYLPIDWLQGVGLNEDNYFDSNNRGELFLVIERILDEAEGVYKHGIEGTRYLPWRSALAVLIAARIYREIGREILRRGSSSLDQRIFVSRIRKMWLVKLAIYDLMKTIPQRIQQKQKTVAITKTWTYSC